MHEMRAVPFFTDTKSYSLWIIHIQMLTFFLSLVFFACGNRGLSALKHLYLEGLPTSSKRRFYFVRNSCYLHVS